MNSNPFNGGMPMTPSNISAADSNLRDMSSRLQALAGLQAALSQNGGGGQNVNVNSLLGHSRTLSGAFSNPSSNALASGPLPGMELAALQQRLALENNMKRMQSQMQGGGFPMPKSMQPNIGASQSSMTSSPSSKRRKVSVPLVGVGNAAKPPQPTIDVSSISFKDYFPLPALDTGDTQEAKDAKMASFQAAWSILLHSPIVNEDHTISPAERLLGAKESLARAIQFNTIHLYSAPTPSPSNEENNQQELGVRRQQQQQQQQQQQW
eukprot:Nitzschia sp. Nitz4//scaffold71_size96697//50615//51412//NITZ4_004697-RA/size96697-processed-gene-0.44-mRNA-1//-1//CDS//3329557253//3837//frame0